MDLCTSCRKDTARHEIYKHWETPSQQNLCCKCWIGQGKTPADWHSECMKAYRDKIAGPVKPVSDKPKKTRVPQADDISCLDFLNKVADRGHSELTKELILEVLNNNRTDLHDEEGNVIRGIDEYSFDYAANEILAQISSLPVTDEVHAKSIALLKQFVNETPKEELQGLIAKHQANDINGVTIDQYFSAMSGKVPTMQWVKASERLPSKPNDYNAKYQNENCVMMFMDNEIQKLRFANGGIYSKYSFFLTSLEWLEEIAQ
jgi:hypothetical protein